MCALSPAFFAGLFRSHLRSTLEGITSLVSWSVINLCCVARTVCSSPWPTGTPYRFSFLFFSFLFAFCFLYSPTYPLSSFCFLSYLASLLRVLHLKKSCTGHTSFICVEAKLCQRVSYPSSPPNQLFLEFYKSLTSEPLTFVVVLLHSFSSTSNHNFKQSWWRGCPFKERPTSTFHWRAHHCLLFTVIYHRPSLNLRVSSLRSLYIYQH